MVICILLLPVAIPERVQIKWTGGNEYKPSNENPPRCFTKILLIKYAEKRREKNQPHYYDWAVLDNLQTTDLNLENNL